MARRRIEICRHCPEFEQVGESAFQCKIVDMWWTDFGSCYEAEAFERQQIAEECPFRTEHDMQEWNDEKKP